MYDACLMHSRAERVLKSLVSKNLEQWNITRMEWLLLASLLRKSKSDTGHTMGEIADVLDIRLSQVTVLVSRMIEAKLLTQTVSGSDRRTRYVNVAPKGKKLLDNIELEMRRAMREWLGSIPRQQLETYMLTVKKLGTDI